MGFVGVSRAVYDYTAQGDDELAIQEGDLLFVFEKDEGDGWIKAKKKASEDDEDEPEGLAPANYVEDVSKDLVNVEYELLTLGPGPLTWSRKGTL